MIQSSDAPSAPSAALRPAHPLDHPIRGALTGPQGRFALGGPAALRFRPAVAGFATTLEDTPEAFAAMHRLFHLDEPMILIQAHAPALPPAFTLHLDRMLEQMVGGAIPEPPLRQDLTPLGAGDVADMMALVELAQPGPFTAGTRELGTYLGIREGGRLIAMAGERMRLDGYTEVSAVCTHPDHRGRGLARALITALVRAITARGERPFLHVLSENASAIALYRQLGFTHRRSLHLRVVGRTR